MNPPSLDNKIGTQEDIVELAMLNPHNPSPLSPTNSSISSSDLDTVSTGSFFHDRSTTLGTLMGVNYPTLSLVRASSSSHRQPPRNEKVRERKRRKMGKRVVIVGGGGGGGGRWWKLCRDEVVEPSSLGEYLEVERRFGDAAADNGRRRVLFDNGRVLPPSQVAPTATAGGALSLSRCLVLITGICCTNGAAAEN